MTDFLSYWRHSKKNITTHKYCIYLNYSSTLNRISRKTCGCDRLESLGSLEETHEVHVQEPVLHQNHYVTHRVHPACKRSNILSTLSIKRRKSVKKPALGIRVFGPPGSGTISQRDGSGSGSFPFFIKMLSRLNNTCEIKF